MEFHDNKRKPGRPASPPKEALASVIVDAPKSPLRKVELHQGSHPMRAGEPLGMYGYVNANGVLFPIGYKAHGATVSYFGHVVMNQCPKCRKHMMAADAIKGLCDNENCGYSAIDEFEAVEL